MTVAVDRDRLVETASSLIDVWSFTGDEEGMARRMVELFEELGLHRLQASIIPRNAPSHRVAAKVGLRNEGTALRYLEINGQWEDHVRYAITSEEWSERREHYMTRWILEDS